MIEPRGGGGVMRAGHYLFVGAVAVVAAVLAFAVLNFVAGLVFLVVKIVVVLAVVGGAIALASREARSRRH